MKLNEIELKSGKKIRRASWMDGYYTTIEDSCVEGEHWLSDQEITIEDYLADDWEELV